MTNLARIAPWCALVVVLAAVWIRDPRAVPDAVAARPDSDQESLERRVRALEARASLESPDMAPVRRPASREPGEFQELRMRIADLEARIQLLEGLPPEVHTAEARAVELRRRFGDVVARGDLADLERLLALGLEVDLRGDDGETPMTLAARYGRIDLLERLFEVRADLELPGDRDMTPLVAAIHGDQADAALRLLDLGSSPQVADSNGESALIWAAWLGQKRVVQRLIGSGANLDHQCHEGGTPLQNAAHAGHLEATRLLLQAGADPNLANQQGQTSLAVALMRGHAEVAELIRQFGGVE